MERKFLEEFGIDKETIDKILDRHSSEIGKAKAPIDELNKQIEKLTNDLKERDNQLVELKKNNTTNEELKTQIENLQKENKTKAEEYAKKTYNLMVNNALEMAFNDNKAKNKKAVRALLDGLDKCEFDENGRIKGLQAQIDKLKNAEDSNFLFEKGEENKFTGIEPGTSGNNGSGVDFSKMTYSQQMKYAKEHPNIKL